MDIERRWLKDIPTLHAFAAEQHAYPSVFLTISGADLYGFPSEDGDYDLRGCHVVPLRAFSDAMLTTRGADKTPGLTVEKLDRDRSPELDFVSHDVSKVLRLALKANGYVLEQILSPLVVATSPEHARLVELAPNLVTRRLYHHYSGFFTNQERLYDKHGTKRIKGLLYQYRVALTGIHVLRTGEIEANLRRLNETFRSSLVSELIARKQAGEAGTLDDDSPFRAEIAVLGKVLLQAFETSTLALEVSPAARQAAMDLVWECRHR